MRAFQYYMKTEVVFGVDARQKAASLTQKHGGTRCLVVYGGGYLGMCYLASWLISGCRYMFGCHALYLSAGRFRHKWAWYALAACEAVCCAWFYYNFMNGQSIM